MSLRRVVWERGGTLCAALGLMVMVSGVAAAQEPSDPNPGNLTLTVGMDFANAYMFRGIRQDDTKVIMWPAADLGLSVYSGEGGLKSAGLNFGVWNSLNTGTTGTDGPNSKLWYEGDFYATFGLGFGGGVGVATTYTAYTIPNNMFSTVKEIMFKLSVDDSSHLGKGAVKPYVIIARELDTSPGQGQADAGLEGGTYIELGVAPGWAASAASLAFPIKVGLSGGNYYEGPDGDDTFGYFSIAGTVTVPLKGVPAKFGSWNIHGGVEFQKLGDTLTAFNLDEDHKVIGSVGFGFSY